MLKTPKNSQKIVRKKKKKKKPLFQDLGKFKREKKKKRKNPIKQGSFLDPSAIVVPLPSPVILPLRIQLRFLWLAASLSLFALLGEY